VNRRLNERNQWNTTLEPLDPEEESLWRMTKRVILLRLPAGHTRGNRSLTPRKPKALADNLETKFQLVTDPSAPAVNEMVDVAPRSDLLTTASKPK
jgi:hypothetical protein